MGLKEQNPFLWLAVAVVATAGVLSVLAIVLMSGRSGYGMMGWGMGWTAAVMVVPVALLVMILLATLGTSLSRPEYPLPTPSALEALKLEYVQGRLGREEYLRMKADLEGRSQGGV